MTKIRLPSLEEATSILPNSDQARIAKIGRRLELAQALARKYLHLEEIELEDLLELAEYIREGVQRLGAAETSEKGGESSEGCQNLLCSVHNADMPESALREALRTAVSAQRSSMPEATFAQVMKLLDDPRTQMIRGPGGVLLQGVAPDTDDKTGLN